MYYTDRVKGNAEAMIVAEPEVSEERAKTDFTAKD